MARRSLLVGHWRLVGGLQWFAFPAADNDGYRLFTLDHDSGELRLDLEHGWQDRSPPVPILPKETIYCDPAAGWLCTRVRHM